MKKILIAGMMLLSSHTSWAVDLSLLQNQDIDLFLSTPVLSISDSNRPNVLIMLDNTANWNTPFTSEKTALVNLFSSLKSDTYNVGLAMFTETGNPNNNVDGLYVRYAIQNMNSSNKASLSTIINNLHVLDDKSNGGKLGQSMRESYNYFAGKLAFSGAQKVKADKNAFTNSTKNSTTPIYQSPADGACQRNFIIHISNGPVQDNTSDTSSAQTSLQGYGGNISPIVINPSGSQSNVGDEWARFMNGKDVNLNQDGIQNVTTYTIEVQPGTTGQGPGMTALLKSMAAAGGGRYVSIKNPLDPNELQQVLDDIFNEILSVNSVFASSTLPVSVNARGQNLNQVYMGVFRPDANAKPRWAGNLKQFKLQFDNATSSVALVDSLSQPVESPTTGFIRPSAVSFWTRASTFWNATSYPDTQGTGGASDAPDGDLVEKGAVAQRLRERSSARNLYTCLNCSIANTLLSSHLFATSNASITNSMLGLGTPTAAQRDSFFEWIKGKNVKQDDPSGGATTGSRGLVHGDVVHSRPVVFNYNRTGQPANRDIAVFYGANDGFLHAVKGGQDAADGEELWAFTPQEFLGGFKRLYDNTPTLSSSNTKTYGFDGPIGVYAKDVNGDNQYTSADKVYIYPTARRGGRYLYALDVTDMNTPKFKWKIDNNTAGFADLGQTWSEPKPMVIKGYANPVLVFSGGYDATANDVNPQVAATLGRSVYIVDAETGALVWKFGNNCTGATGVCTTVSGMNHSITSDPVRLDTDRNGYIDRLYVSDTGANIWRIDIEDLVSTSLSSSNFAVNKIASLGGSGVDSRKFLFAPDILFDGAHYMIYIGSGDREKPYSMSIKDKVFAIQDLGVGKTNLITTPIVIGDLYDTTANLIQQGTNAEVATATTSLANAKGWFISLNGTLSSRDLACGKVSGEKVVGGIISINNRVYFGTNIPAYVYDYGNTTSGCSATIELAQNSCNSSLGLARLYSVSYKDGSAVIDRNGSTGSAGQNLTAEDRYKSLVGGGLPPTPIVAAIDGQFAVIIGSDVDAAGNTDNFRKRVYWYEKPN